MALQFETYKSAYYSAADWLDNISAFSWAGWVRIDTIQTGSKQYPWGHYGSTNRISLRKNNGTPELFRWAVVSGGVAVTVDDTTGAPVAGTWYHLACTWEPGSATGAKIYRNGAFVASASTTGQTGTYDSGGGIPLYLAHLKAATDDLEGSIEGFGFWAGTVLTANQIAALYWCGWPHLAGCPKPSAFYAMTEGTVTRIPDLSGNSRHIESTTIDATGVTAVATSGKWEAPDELPGGYYDQGTSGPAPPAAWTLFATVTHPTVTSTVTGLTNGTAYEFVVTALDATGNESNYSAIVEATPQAVATKHTPALKWIGH